MRLRIIDIARTIPLLSLILLSSCKIQVKPGNRDEDKKLTVEEIEKFHSLFNSNDFETIYTTSSRQFQKAITKAEMNKLLKSEHDDVGVFKRIIDKRINVIIGAPVQVRAVYLSEYSNADVTEMFIYVKEEDGLKLLFINPTKGRSKLPDLENN